MAARPFFLLSVASTNLTALGNANLAGGYVINTNAAIRYLKFYNAPTGGTVPVVGTAVPFLTVQLPASSATLLSQVFAPVETLQCSGPVWLATTVNIAASDTTGVGAGDLYIHVFLDGP